MPTELTRTQRELLSILHLRDDLGDAWLFREPRNRWALYVPTLFGKPGEYLRSVNGATLRDLHRAGLIEYGPDTTEKPFAVRRVHADSEGSTVRLTEKGRAHDDR